MGAFFTLADHDNQTDALLALTLAQDPLSREHIPMGMEYLALTDPVSTAISQQEEGIRGFWHAVLPVLFWLCSENSDGEDRETCETRAKTRRKASTSHPAR